MSEQHEHTWEATGLAWGAVGQRWQQGGQWHYCADCGAWGVTKTMFLDGDFYKSEGEARKRNEQIKREMALERGQWLKQRHPDRFPDPVETLPPELRP